MRRKTSAELRVVGTANVIVRKAFDEIERCRVEGNKLPQIYEALVVEHDLRVTFGSFKNAYYKHRQNKKGHSRENYQQSQVVEPEPEIRQEPAKTYSSSRSTEKAIEKETDTNSEDSNRPFQRLELGGTIEEQQAIAAEYFNQY